MLNIFYLLFVTPPQCIYKQTGSWSVGADLDLQFSNIFELQIGHNYEYILYSDFYGQAVYKNCNSEMHIVEFWYFE